MIIPCALNGIAPQKENAWKIVLNCNPRVCFPCVYTGKTKV
jgi:hypothetical protein